MSLTLALDVGGTKLAAAVVDPEALYETLLAGAAAAMRGADAVPGDLSGIGVGCGGPMRWPEGSVSPLNIPALGDFPLRRRLAKEFGAEPVLVHNDAVAIAAGEHWKGAGVGTANLLGLTVSTGVDGGLLGAAAFVLLPDRYGWDVSSA